MRCAWGSSASPALVSSICPRVRTKSGEPSEFSSTRICFDNVGWETPTRSAAWVKCRVRATAAKYASCWTCMGIQASPGHRQSL